jgi:IclR family transcriptional regulator, KDG regulon repressor
MSDIQSVRRAFDILRAVSANAEGVCLTEIAARVELPKSTVSRMLSTLVGLGAVERLREREGFRIGNEIVTIASNVAYPQSVTAIARPYLQQLSQLTGETLTLCIPDGDEALYIDQINSLRGLQVRDWTGQRLPLHTASDGKLYLADRTDDAVEAYLRQQPMRRYTRNTIANATALRKEIKAIRKKGYAWTKGEYDSDVVGVAAPIRDVQQHVIASVCLFGPEFRWPQEGKAGHLIRVTRETAEKISERIQAMSQNHQRANAFNKAQRVKEIV